MLDRRKKKVHRFHLADAEWAPTAADEAEYQASSGEQVGGRDDLAIVVLQLEMRRFCVDVKNVSSEISLLEISNRLRVDGLGLRRNVLRDQLFALGENLAKRSRVGVLARFF